MGCGAQMWCSAARGTVRSTVAGSAGVPCLHVEILQIDEMLTWKAVMDPCCPHEHWPAAH